MTDTDNKTFFWIKLRKDFFRDDGPIDFLMAQPNGAQYVVLYQMLCLKAANTGGVLAYQIGEMIVPYDTQKIVRDTKYFDIDTVTIALNLFKQLGLVFKNDGENLVQIKYDGLGYGQESGEASAQRQRKRREKIKQEDQKNALCDRNRDKMSQESVTKSVTKCNTEYRVKSIELRDKSIEYRDQISESEDRESPLPPSEPDFEAEKEPEEDIRERINYDAIKNAYNEICKSFPKCTVLSDKRKKMIKASCRLGFDFDSFREAFEKAEASSFLKGNNSRAWSATFDWMIEPNHLTKIIEGNYSDKGTGSKEAELETQYTKFAQWAAGGAQ